MDHLNQITCATQKPDISYNKSKVYGSKKARSQHTLNTTSVFGLEIGAATTGATRGMGGLGDQTAKHQKRPVPPDRIPCCHWQQWNVPEVRYPNNPKPVKPAEMLHVGLPKCPGKRTTRPPPRQKRCV